MDDDSDCDVYAAVTAYCNSNVDQILDKIQPEKEEDEEKLEHERIAEIEQLCEYKSTRGKSSRRSRGRGTGRATEKGETDTSLMSECAPQESQPRGRGRGRRRGKRGTQPQPVQNEVDPSSLPSQATTGNVPRQSGTEAPQSGRRTRTNRRCQRREGPVIAVINLGCDSDTPQEPIFARQRRRKKKIVVSKEATALDTNKVIYVSSSENESAEHENSGAAGGLEDSFDSLNPEISVKIWLNDKIEKFTMRKYQKFSDIIKIIADREKTKPENVFLRIDTRIINPTDSPDSVNYKIHQFINTSVIKNPLLSRNAFICGERKIKDPNLLEFKVQSNAWKKPLMMSMRKEETFQVLYAKCAEELKLPYDKIKLIFDGDQIEYEDTPEDLELEGQEVIDCEQL